MSIEEAKKVLLALPHAELRRVLADLEEKNRARLYAEFEAAQHPRDLARWEELIAKYGESSWCQEVDNILDGFVIHARECTYWPKTFFSSGRCIHLTKIPFRP